MLSYLQTENILLELFTESFKNVEHIQESNLVALSLLTEDGNINLVWKTNSSSGWYYNSDFFLSKVDHLDIDMPIFEKTLKSYLLSNHLTTVRKISAKQNI